MSTDAISPLLYPDLMASTDFVVSLFPVKITTEDGELSTDYYTYIYQHQKQSIWSVPFNWIRGQLKAFFLSCLQTKKNVRGRRENRCFQAVGGTEKGGGFHKR